jgi:hypothetical protein
MAENNNNSIFQRVYDAVNNNKRQTPPMDAQGQQAPGISTPSQGLFGSLEDFQQQYLDWQVNKISHDLYTRTIYYDTDRINSYHDYRAMDQSPEVAAALDIMRDECLTRNERGNILEIYSSNDRIKSKLDDLFYNRMNIDYNLSLWIRDLIKYGDYFVHLHVHKDEGIYDFMTLPQEEIHREEGFDGTASSVRFRWETTQDYFESWQIAHFRLIEDTRKLPYGRSVLDSARKLWKQLQLAEDSMLVYRITRAPERRIFYIEVGNLEDADVKQYMQRIQRQVKKQPVVNQNNGQQSFRYDPMNVSEDYFIPVRGDKSTKIDTLPGASNLGDIQDIEYLENKLFAALKVPKTYLNYAENLPGGPTLSQADLRFSRTINRIQEQVLMELRRIAKIHLAFLGHEDEINDFDLKLTNPSTQQELLKLETMKSRLEVFSMFVSQDIYSPASYTWGMKYILGFSEKDIKKMLRQKKVERKLFTEIEFAPQTYKKIGLFKDLDDKFEIPGASEALQNAENEDIFDAGGGDAGGFGGGGGDSLAGDPTGGLDMGGDDTDGAGAAGGGFDVGAADADPLSETRRKRIWEGHDKRVDGAIDDLLKELEETDEEVFTETEDKEENALFKSNETLTNQTDKMISEIKGKLEDADKEIDNYNIPKGVIRERNESNPLVSTSNNLADKARNIMAEIDKQIAESNDPISDIEVIDEEYGEDQEEQV